MLIIFSFLPFFLYQFFIFGLYLLMRNAFTPFLNIFINMDTQDEIEIIIIFKIHFSSRSLFNKQ